MCAAATGSHSSRPRTSSAPRRPSPRPDVIDRMQAAPAPEDAHTTAYRQAEEFDRFLTGEREPKEISGLRRQVS
jgi:hypothetical protein